MVSTMAEANIHILLVEDNPGDARLLRALLEEVAPRRFTFTQAGRLSEATSRLKAGGIDLILLDLSLPDSQGFATLAAIRQAIMHTPIVVLTGLEDEALGLQLIQQGAQDYLVKRQVTGPLLQRSLRYALERARMAAELRQKSTLLQSVLDSIADGVVVADHTGEFQVWNPAAGRIIGSGPSDVGISKWSSHFGLFLPDGTTPYPPEELPLVRAIRGESLNDVILLLKNDHRPDGRWLSVNARPLRGASGHIKGGVAVFRDITTQQKTEDALRESQERFQAIMNNSPILIFLKDASGRYLQINRKTEETIQLSDRDVRGKTDEELFPANQVSNWQAHDRQVLTTGLPMEFEESATHPDGPHTYMVVKFPLFNARRECDAVCGMATDITVRKRIEEERSRRALRLVRQQSALTDFTRNRIFQRSDLPGTLRHITELVARTLQIERVGLWRYNGPRDALHCIDQYELSRDRHLEGTPIPVASRPVYFQLLSTSQMIAADDLATDTRTAQLYGGDAPEGVTSMMDIPLYLFGRLEGVLCHEHIGLPRRWMEDEWMFAIATSHLVALAYEEEERTRAEVQLHESEERLRNLTRRLESVREEERTRIAREVHDELGQALTGVKLELAFLRDQLADVRSDLHERATSIIGHVDQTMQSVRKIATELRPVVLDQLGLIPAIEWQAREFQNRTGIRCILNIYLRTITLPVDRSTGVFRIFQEVLTNIARHAGASEAAITMQEHTGNLLLQVHDNGRGITDEEISASHSLGLVGMRERALLLGGEAKIERNPEEGTTVTLRIPLEGASND